MSDIPEAQPQGDEPPAGPPTVEDPANEWPGPDVTPADSPAPESPMPGAVLAEDWAPAIEALGERLSGRLDAIQVILERESRAEANRERVVDRLHAELQEYKQDLLLRVQRPIFIDLIQLHDDIGKMIEARPGVDVDDDRNLAVRGILDSIRIAIEDILYRQGVEPFTEEGESFDPRRQRAVATVPTDDPTINKAIAARLHKGFRVGERVIRPELVSVYTTRPPAPAGPPS